LTSCNNSSTPGPDESANNEPTEPLVTDWPLTETKTQELQNSQLSIQSRKRNGQASVFFVPFVVEIGQTQMIYSIAMAMRKGIRLGDFMLF